MVVEEHRVQLVVGDARRLGAAGLEHHPRHLAGVQAARDADAIAGRFDVTCALGAVEHRVADAMEGERQVVGDEHGTVAIGGHDPVRRPPVVELGWISAMNDIVPRTTRSIRTSRCRSVASPPATGMKSISSPTPSSVMNRVMRIAVFGRYSWRDT